MIDYYWVVAVLFVVAFTGQYFLGKMGDDEDASLKKIQTVRFITMTSYFLAGILCILYFINKYLLR